MSPTHHAINYVEIPAPDLDAAQRFYGEAFGWRFNDYGGSYAGIQDPADPSAEVGGLRPATDGGPGGPLVLLYSEDLDGSVAAVETAGGIVVEGPYEFPGGRRFHFTDPGGVELGVWGK